MLANGRQSFAVLSISLSASFMIYDLSKDTKALMVVCIFCSENSSRNFYLENNELQ